MTYAGEVKCINGKRVATPEYRSWQMMKNRCLNPRAYDWKYYGGRGINICDAWHLFSNFIADMGRRPTPEHTLERQHTDKDYYKDNCYWATREQQARNRRYCKMTIELARLIRNLYETGQGNQYQLAARFGVSQRTISLITRGESWREIGGGRL